MATTSTSTPPVVWWHSMSCICNRCLERDRIAGLGVPFPASWQMVPARVRLEAWPTIAVTIGSRPRARSRSRCGPPFGDLRVIAEARKNAANLRTRTPWQRRSLHLPTPVSGGRHQTSAKCFTPRDRNRSHARRPWLRVVPRPGPQGTNKCAGLDPNRRTGSHTMRSALRRQAACPTTLCTSGTARSTSRNH